MTRDKDRATAAFGRVELFSFLRFLARPLKGRSSTAVPATAATSRAVPLVSSVEEPGFSPASGGRLSRALAPVVTYGMRGSSRRRFPLSSASLSMTKPNGSGRRHPFLEKQIPRDARNDKPRGGRRRTTLCG